ncbi:hypothetical protein RQM65_03170 [Pricia sp. S334]|uniref:Uncharacterized protein n=1 Tax=Pricia mediterranea TaxID=3076079 RepID=A0ABU3L1R1_9FLAO|nr:hypothetical protein [Pricia sp. S334]MDT7827666.1 hypothetical protein [Pricia sp. S334]
MYKTDLNFKQFLSSINKCYSKEYQDKLPKLNDFKSELFGSENNLSYDRLIEFVKKTNNVYLKSVSLRMLAIINIQNAREKEKNLDIEKTWELIRESIQILPKECTISSIGSQGFLSIPLFKYEEEKTHFDFIRLHIWDEDLSKYIDTEKCEKFSIHTHSFFAESWPICGKVINDRYSAKISDSKTENSLFTVEYNKSLNEVNQHTSNAINTGKDVDLKQISHEVHMKGSHYQIDAGKYHKSGSIGENGISATFFSFTAENGLVNQSYVVGASDIKKSEINRKMYIDPTPFLKKISKEI